MKFISKEMNLNFNNALGYLTFKNLESYDFINHFFATRIGGVSKNEFKSLNFSFLQGDSKKNVEENYNILCRTMDVDFNKLASASQVHGNRIKVVTEHSIRGKTREERRFKAFDGFVTNVPGITLMTLHADCCVIFMIDPIKRAVGLVHAGWRGTAKGIAKNLVQAFIKTYGSDPRNLICGIGPCIGKCCFEADNVILPHFAKLNIGNDYFNKTNIPGKIKIDLAEVNKRVIVKEGVLLKNISVSDVCTMCNKDLLFSHRATNGKRGNNAAFICIK